MMKKARGQELIPATKELHAEASKIVVWARGFAAIRDTDHYVEAAEARKTVNAVRRKIVDFFRPFKQKADEAKKVLLEAEKHELTSVDAALAIMDAGRVRWERDQERLRQQEEARLREVARQEQRRLRAIAEAEAEAQRMAEAAAVIGTTDDIEADIAAAEEILEAPLPEYEPVVVAVPRVASAVPKVAGIVTRTTWKASVTDKLAVIRYVAAHVAARPELAELLDVNMPAANALARAARGESDLQGLRFYEESSVASRGGGHGG